MTVKNTKTRIGKILEVQNDTCRPRQAEGNWTQTRNMTDDPELQDLCPAFKPGEEVCCTPIQLKALRQNFFTINQIFGTDGQGCDICAANLKRFWCYFTCSPVQDTFLKIIGESYHVVGKNESRLLTDIDLFLEEDMNCQLFKSCKKVKFASQVPAMGNSLGFINFQGVNAYQKIAVYIYLHQNKGEGMTFPINKCDEEPDEHGYIGGYYINETCTCSSCESKCDYSLVNSTPVFEGLSVATIAIVYSIALVITGLLIFYRLKFKNGLDDNEDLEDIKESDNFAPIPTA